MNNYTQYVYLLNNKKKIYNISIYPVALLSKVNRLQLQSSFSMYRLDELIHYLNKYTESIKIGTNNIHSDAEHISGIHFKKIFINTNQFSIDVGIMNE